MDDPNRQRRQNDVPMHPSSNPRYHQPPQDPSQQRRSFGGGAPSERFRPAPVNTSATAAARGMSGSSAYSGYYQEPPPNAFPTAAGIPQGAIGYHQPTADYGQDARQGFTGAYGQANMMYNVPQTGSQSSVYDTSHQFSSRQPAGLGMMATDVTGPYFQGEPTNAAAAHGIQQQGAPASTSSNVYQQGQNDRSNLMQSYAGQMTTMSNMGTQQPPGATADTNMEEQEYRAPGGLEEAYASYQTALKEIFQNIIGGVLASASESLLNVSDWLLSHVAELGLNIDDQSLHADRIKLWNDFNHAWLALLQKQKDMMESRQQLQRSQTLVSPEGLEKMGKELVRLCDGVERHGLVDYQYGVWEEQIIAILTECLDLYETTNTGSATAGAGSHRA